MKTKSKLVAFFTLLVLSFVSIQYSCSDDLKNENPTGLPDYELRNDTCSHPDITYINQIYNTDIEISTDGVSKNSAGYLEFETQQTFINIMSEIVNNSYPRIDDWESSLGFSSRRSYCNRLISSYSVNIDTLYRVEDRYFESVLDSLDRISIEDTLYSYDWVNSTVTLYTNGNEPIVRSLNSCWDETCTQTSWKAPNKEYESGAFLTCYKWRSNYLVYSSIGVDVNSRHVGTFGWEWPLEADEISLVLDQWHEIEFYFAISPYPTNIVTNIKKSVENETDLTWVVANGYFYSEICTPKFERIHFYYSDYYDDGHHDTNYPQ